MPLDDKTAELLAKLYTATDPEQLVARDTLATLLKAVDEVTGAFTVAEGGYVSSVTSPELEEGIKRYNSNASLASRKASVASRKSSSTLRRHLDGFEDSLREQLESGRPFRGRVQTEEPQHQSVKSRGSKSIELVAVPIQSAAQLEDMIESILNSQFEKNPHVSHSSVENMRKDITSKQKEIEKIEATDIERLNLQIKKLEQEYDRINGNIIPEVRPTENIRREKLQARLNGINNEIISLKDELKGYQGKIEFLNFAIADLKRKVDDQSHSLNVRRQSKEGAAHLIVSLGKNEVDGYSLKGLYDGLEKFLSKSGFDTLKSIAGKIPENIREDLMISVLKNVQQQQLKETKEQKSLTTVFNNLPNMPWREALGYPVGVDNLRLSEKIYARVYEIDNPRESVERKASTDNSRAEAEKVRNDPKSKRLHAFLQRTVQKVVEKSGFASKESGNQNAPPKRKL